MIRLSVNLNKVALLRNSRRHGVPDLGAEPLSYGLDITYDY
jgi:pyridoxine 5'-phosphate synthase PdxJ